MHHATLHLQPTEVMTGETTTRRTSARHFAAEVQRIPDYLATWPPSAGRSRTCPPRTWPARLCPPLHVVVTHSRDTCTHNHTPFLTIRSTHRNPLQEQISFWIQGSRMVSEGGRLLIQSSRFIFTSIQNDTTSQSETNERGVVPSSALIKRKIKKVTCLQWIPITLR